MQLLELAFQGVRGLGAAPCKLQPTVNAILVPPAGADAFVRAILALWFGPVDGEGGLVASRAQAAQGVAIVSAGDGAAFRLTRDLTNGRARLESYQRAERRFLPVSEDTHEITQFLRARAGWCERETFEAAFFFSAEQLPSRAGAGRRPAAAAPERATATALRSTAQGDEARRLAEIEAQLAAAGRVEALEFELDGLQKRRFAVDDQMRALPDPSDAVARAQASLARHRVPPDFGERYGAYLRQVARRDEDLKRWEQERERVARDAPATPAQSLAKSPGLWIGSVGGVAALATGALLGGSARYVALLDIPLFGLAATVLWWGLGRRARSATVARRLALLDERRAKILERDAASIQGVERILEDLGLSSAGEVRAAILARKEAEESLRLAFGASAESDIETRRAMLLAERATLDVQIADLEDKLVRAGAGLNLGALRSEAASLRVRLAGSVAHASAPTSAVAAACDGAASGRVAALVRAACNLWLTDVNAGTERLAQAASPLVARMNSGRVAALVAHGATLAAQAVDGHELAWPELERAEQDAVYFALRSALVLGCDPRARMPLLVLDEGGASPWLSPSALAQLAGAGQVLFVTSDPARAPAGSSRVAVGGA